MVSPIPARNHVSVPVDLPLKQRIQAAVRLYGEPQVVERSLSLMAGNNEGVDFLLFVGGEHARGLINGAPVLYWPELWGLRALLHVWDASAAPFVIDALDNRAWRVREMAARVAAERELDASTELAIQLTDTVVRVRATAARSLGQVGTMDDIDRLRPLLKDPEIEVRRGAQQGIALLRERFQMN